MPLPPDPFGPLVAVYLWLIAWLFAIVAGCALLALAVTAVAGPFVWLWQRVRERR